jgi:hypothetical protein
MTILSFKSILAQPAASDLKIAKETAMQKIIDEIKPRDDNSYALAA